MDIEKSTPKTQGFLNYVKRIRVSRDLSGSREANTMENWLIIQYSLYRMNRDRGVTLPPSDGIDG